MSILIFDTETTGLPNYSDPSDHPDQPHIVEASWTLYSLDGEPLEVFDAIVDPGPGVRFHEDAVAVHGITPEIAAAEGIPPAALLEQFLDVLKRTSLVSGFHISFDLRMIRILSARVTGDKWDCETPKQCSMSLTNTYIKTLPKKPAGYKWPPTLGQSIGMIFDEEFPEAHRARPDCDAAARLYFELTKRLAA